MSELVRTFLVAPLPLQTGPLFRMLQKSASKGSVPSPRGAARWRPLFPSRTLGHLRLSQLARSVVGPSLTSGADANCNCEIELRPCVCARARACQERCQWHDVGATVGASVCRLGNPGPRAQFPFRLGYCLRTGVPGFCGVRFWAPKSADGWVLTVPQVPYIVRQRPKRRLEYDF